MTNFRRVTEQFSVAPQIALEDIPIAAEDGYTLLINNRPDGESPGQPTSAQVEAAAKAAGMKYAYVPVMGGPAPDAVQAEMALLDEASGPVLAFCRSGTRSIMLWAVTQVALGEHTRDDLLALGREAGYDLSGVLGG